MKLSEEYISHIRDIIPDADEYFAALDKNPSKALWVNQCKMKTEDFIKSADFPIKKIPFADNAFIFEKEGIGNTAFHHSGAVYSQEPSAMAVISAIENLPDAPIIDICASPGGKSLQAAQKLGSRQVLISNEYSSQRIKQLYQNIERCGIRNSIITNFDGYKISEYLPALFGTVIVDAPCSGEGMMRKSENEQISWNPESIRISAERQKNILASAKKLLMAGGILIYSTCTFAIEENEKQIAEFLKENEDFSLIAPKKEVMDASLPGIDIDGYGNIDFSLCRRFYPHKSIGEGQFLAIMKKAGEISIPEIKIKNSISKQSEKITLDFLSSILKKMPDMALSEEKDGIYLIPRFPKITKGVFSAGVKLGMIQKGRMIPHHRFFSAFGDDFLSSAEIGDDPILLEKYLRGEEIPFDIQNGFCAVKFKGATIGGGKASGGIIKNHYPKGLRKNPE